MSDDDRSMASGPAHASAPEAGFKVAYLVNQYPKVSHSFIRREILALERRGVEVERFAVRGWDGASPDAADAEERTRTRYLLRDGVAALVGPLVRAAFASPGRLFTALKLAVRMSRHADRGLAFHLVYLAQACLLCEWLRASRVAHLHAHFGTNSAEVAMLAHALGGPPYSFTVHGPEEFDKPSTLRLADKVSHATFVVAISSFGRSQLYRWISQAQWAKVEVVHCGLDADFHRAQPSGPPDVPRLVCVGRLCEQKGQMLLLEATARLAAGGVPIELVLAGDGEMRSELEAVIRAHGLEARVRITGWIGGDQVRSELLAARALVLPSFAEGLPVVIMEAMALQRPVLSTFVAGIPELVRNGIDGWLFPAGDVDELVGAMRACLATPIDELARMGASARARVLARHDIDVEASKLAALFARSAVATGVAA